MLRRIDTDKIKNFRYYIKESKMVAGFLVTLSDPSAIETYSFIHPELFIVDMEHSDISYADLTDMVVRSLDVPIVARIMGNDKNHIKKVLDTGVDGIIIPGIENYDGALSAVKYSHFPPIGIRGIGPGRASGYGKLMVEYIESKPLVIIQIETEGAFREIDKIAKIENLDGIFVGPVDLSSSLGMTFSWEDNEFVNAVKKILDFAHRYDLITGIYSPFDRKSLIEIEKLNVNFLMFGMDREALLMGYGESFDLLKNIRAGNYMPP